MFKLLVCGSRDIKDHNFVYNALDFMLSNKDLNEVEIIHGDQKSWDKATETLYGADYFAKCWAMSRGVKQTPFPADWDRHKKFAGPIRNSEMLNEKPDACIAFFSIGSKNRGTSDMLKKVKGKGILSELPTHGRADGMSFKG